MNLIVGGTGSLGHAAAKRLLALGEHVLPARERGARWPIVYIERERGRHPSPLRFRHRTGRRRVACRGHWGARQSYRTKPSGTRRFLPDRAGQVR
jgi:NAD(P)-dependent dehydrogenase (short-subunit alcohol dehydrogenase family)